MAKKPKDVEVEDDGQLIDVDHPEDKALIRQIKRVAACNRAESAARDESQQQREKLLDMMKEKGLVSYKHGRYSATVKHMDKVSVKSEESNGDEE